MPPESKPMQTCLFTLDQIDFSENSQDYLIYVPQSADTYTIYFIKKDQLESMGNCPYCPMTRSPNPYQYVQLSEFNQAQKAALNNDSYRGEDIEASIKEIINRKQPCNFYNNTAQGIPHEAASLPFYRSLNPHSFASGIFYSLAHGRTYNNLEMKDHLVNYNLIRCSNIFAHSHSLFEKVKSVHEVLCGNHYDLYLTGNGSKGLVDFLIFPLIARRLIADRFRPEATSRIKTLLAFTIAIPLEIARFSISVAITLITLPFVVLTHLLSNCRPSYANANANANLEEESTVSQDADQELSPLPT